MEGKGTELWAGCRSGPGSGGRDLSLSNVKVRSVTTDTRSSVSSHQPHTNIHRGSPGDVDTLCRYCRYIQFPM